MAITTFRDYKAKRVYRATASCGVVGMLINRDEREYQYLYNIKYETFRVCVPFDDFDKYCESVIEDKILDTIYMHTLASVEESVTR